MDFLNLVILRGVVGAIQCSTVGGSTHLSFSVITDYCFTDKEGRVIIETTWHQVSYWQKKGENLSGVLKKGSIVEVTGRLRVRRHTRPDRGDGVTTDIFANTIKCLNEFNKDVFLGMQASPGCLAEGLGRCFHNISVEYKKSLLDEIKCILREKFELQDGRMLNLRDVLLENSVDIVSKIDWIKDFAVDFALFGYRIDKNGTLLIKSYDIDDNNRDDWVFVENAMDISELEDVVEQLNEILSNIADGTLKVLTDDSGGNQDMIVKPADE